MNLSNENPSSAGATPGAAPPVIDIRELSKVYATGDVEVHALRSIGLTIKRGEMVAIMGQSGSGKSTLMNIIGTLDRPSSGSYRLDGVKVEDLSETELARLRNQKIGFVFQSFNLLARHTAVANVEVPLIYGRIGKAERRQRAIEALDRVGLRDRMDHHPNQLSGGQQQRVAIARALAAETPLFLLDEPFAALDALTRERLQEDVRRVSAESGRTTVFVTHSADEAAFLGSRIVVLTRRPGQVALDIPVDLPRTGVDAEELRRSPEYSDLRAEVGRAVKAAAA